MIVDHLEGPKITEQMIEEVIASGAPGKIRLWLVRSKGTWNVVVADGVDGSEEHVLTYATVLSQTPRILVGTEMRFECLLAAVGFNSMFFTR